MKINTKTTWARKDNPKIIVTVTEVNTANVSYTDNRSNVPSKAPTQYFINNFEEILK